MNAVSVNSIAPGASNYDLLADALNGLYIDGDDGDDMTLNRLEISLQQKVKAVIDGEYPLDSLPIFPTTASALLPRLNDSEVSLERIEPMVAQDPALAAEVIKLVNDGFLKRSLKPVTSLEQALGVLEIEQLRTILLKALLRPSIPIKPIFYNLVGRPLWDHARDCATACKTLARNHQIGADDGYLLGLVHDAGKLVIFKLLCSAFRATSATVSPRAGIVARMVQRYANELSHCLAQHWNFPASFLDAIEEQGSAAPARMSPLGRTLFQGNLVAEAYVVMQKHRFSRSTLDEALRRFDLSLDLVYSIFPAAPRPAAR
ncbi:MAG: HDOD domain-containing protein [Gammaproteobacteria bacterium]